MSHFVLMHHGLMIMTDDPVTVINGYANRFSACLSSCSTHLEPERPELHSAEDQVEHHDRGGPEARYDVRVQGSCSH